MAAVIEVEGLRKEYRRFRKPRTVALDGFDLEVPEGGVFGFLGPNGAGKTTTIRCLLGWSARPGGRACGATSRRAARRDPRIGSIVEAPALYPRFTGRRNLEILARIDGIDRGAVDAALDRVGLSARGGDMVRTYSLGMKQRLGIAAALLKDPSLLILDEPANGLDPAGIVEVRGLLRSLGAEGARCSSRATSSRRSSRWRTASRSSRAGSSWRPAPSTSSRPDAGRPARPRRGSRGGAPGARRCRDRVDGRRRPAAGGGRRDGW